MLSITEATLRTTPAAGAIRSFRASDAREVAELLQRAFHASDAPAPTGMLDYLCEVYLDAPWFDPDIASRVFVRADGRIVGFVGVSAMPMSLDGHRIRTAVISSLAVDPRDADSLTCPRLLRHVCAGPQEAVLSDRSNSSAVSLLQTLKGEVCRNYSAEWVRTLRPAGFAVDNMAGRFKAARLLAALALPLDDATEKKAIRSEGTRRTAGRRARPADAFADRSLGHDELLDLVPRFLADFPLRPEWTRAELSTVVSDASRKAVLGEFVSCVVEGPNSEPVGLFLYHLRRGRVAHVLQIMAAKGREAVVVGRAIAHASANGAVAIRGRAQPALADALMDGGAAFLPDLATVVCTRDRHILEHFRAGTAFFTGLAGENWMRLNGDRFDSVGLLRRGLPFAAAALLSRIVDLGAIESWSP
ncbi:MAG: GNAT family N-acetyltransferase [Deltaproteobacteria bacterium]|nr:GNAT family N-acetyltransferase [Deltaproteobacteria bacterium]